MAEKEISCKIPMGDGTPFLLNDIFSKNEYDDNQSIAVDSNISIMIKKYKGHFFIGITCKHLETLVTDVYLYPGGEKIYQLQASAGLCERELNLSKNGITDADWIIGNPDQWISTL